MVTSNRLSSIATCPPKTEGWTPLSGIPAAILNDDAPKILAKGYPQGLCQKTDPSSEVTSYFVQNDASTLAFVDLLLTPRPSSKLEAPPMSDEEKNVALALVTARRHPEPEASAQLAVFEKNPPPMVDPDVAGIEWLVVDANLTPALVKLIRHEMKDSIQSDLFRQAERGVSYYITTDTEKIFRMVSILEEIKRDLSSMDQQDMVLDVNQAAVQLHYLQSHLQATQPIWKKPFRELWPMAVMSLGGLIIGGYITGFGFAKAGLHVQNAYQKKLAKEAAEKAKEKDKGPDDPDLPTGGSGSGFGWNLSLRFGPKKNHPTEFSTLDDRVDAGEQADFQRDPTRAYDPIHHLHINGTAVAAVVVVAGGVMLLMPITIPYVAAASPEAVSLATGFGAFAAAH